MTQALNFGASGCARAVGGPIDEDVDPSEIGVTRVLGDSKFELHHAPRELPKSRQVADLETVGVNAKAEDLTDLLVLMALRRRLTDT